MRRPNERTGDLPPAVATLTNTWKEATHEGSARPALFNDGSQHYVNQVKLLKFDAPGGARVLARARPSEHEKRGNKGEADAMAKRAKTLVWSTIKDDAGVVLGSYAIDGRLIGVRSAVNEEEEWTQLGGSAAYPEALARIILSEAKMRRPLSS